MDNPAGLVADCHFAIGCPDVETPGCAASHPPGMSPAVFPRWDIRLYHVPRLKTKMALLSQTVAGWKAVFVGSAYLA
jgi:hypothetical protein